MSRNIFAGTPSTSCVSYFSFAPSITSGRRSLRKELFERPGGGRYFVWTERMLLLFLGRFNGIMQQPVQLPLERGWTVEFIAVKTSSIKPMDVPILDFQMLATKGILIFLHNRAFLLEDLERPMCFIYNWFEFPWGPLQPDSILNLTVALTTPVAANVCTRGTFEAWHSKPGLLPRERLNKYLQISINRIWDSILPSFCRLWQNLKIFKNCAIVCNFRW